LPLDDVDDVVEGDLDESLSVVSVLEVRDDARVDDRELCLEGFEIKVLGFFFRFSSRIKSSFWRPHSRLLGGFVRRWLSIVGDFGWLMV